MTPLSCFRFYSPSIQNYITSQACHVLPGSFCLECHSIKHITPWLPKWILSIFQDLAQMPSMSSPPFQSAFNWISQCSQNCIRIFILYFMVHLRNNWFVRPISPVSAIVNSKQWLINVGRMNKYMKKFICKRRDKRMIIWNWVQPVTRNHGPWWLKNHIFLCDTIIAAWAALPIPRNAGLHPGPQIPPSTTLCHLCFALRHLLPC